MPTYYVEIEKKLGSEFWTNRWIVRNTSLATANVPIAVALVDAERSLHSTAVTFTRYRVSTTAVGDEEYVIVPLGVQGLRDQSGALLPLFNTLRVDFPAGFGRPSRKYFRGVLTEVDIEGDAIVTNFNSLMAAFVDNFAETAEGPGLVDPQEQLFANAVPIPYVQMRQLRRSRRRRTNGQGIFQ